MGRRRQHPIDLLAALPWPVGAALGITGFAAIRYAAPAWLAHASPIYGRAFGQDGGVLRILAWMWLLACLLAASAAYVNQRRRRKLLDTRSNLQSLADTGWRNFERLVGEAFRRQGYGVEETGLGGADGGIDLILRRDGKRTLVQCKQWKQQVGVSVVREMYGLLAHHQAAAVKIVTTGSYTRDAAAFAQGKPIELVTGEQLLDMIRAVQAFTPASPVDSAPDRELAAPEAGSCPRCGSPQVERRNRRTGQLFMGCSRFPACK